MKCVICKYGATDPGTTTMTLERDTTTIVFKNVPAEVCQTCGEAYVDAATTRKLLHIVEEATQMGIQVDVRSYAAEGEKKWALQAEAAAPLSQAHKVVLLSRSMYNLTQAERACSLNHLCPDTCHHTQSKENSNRMLLETLPLVLFIVLTELSIGSVGVLMFLDWRNEVKRGFLVSYAFIYLVLVGLTYLFQQGFATPQLLNTYKMLDHAWTGYQATPLLVFFLLLILYSVLLLVDRTAGIDAKKQEEQAKAEGVTVRPSIVRIVRLTAGALTVLAGLVTLFVMAMIYRPLGGSTFGGAFLVLGFFASAFALGGVMTSMWLGHWYLVTPALSERPLLFSTSVVLIAILAQIVFSVLAGPSTASAAKANIHTNSTSAAIVATTAASPAHKPAQVKPASNTPTVAPLSAGAIGWLRILVGFALPLVLGGLAWKLIRDRSFQSATGMLYLVVVLTLAGEIMGRGLFLIGLV